MLLLFSCYSVHGFAVCARGGILIGEGRIATDHQAPAGFPLSATRGALGSVIVDGVPAQARNWAA